jgi:mono/diheme cytochrome c family protein
MKRELLVGLLLIVCAQMAGTAQGQAPAAGTPGDAAKGRQLYSGQAGGAYCMLCHGSNAEGGLGPDLAGGRGLTFEQFTRSIKQPWGIMPTFPYLDDRKIADLWAFVQSAPKTPQPGKWRTAMPPAGGPVVQREFISMGCGQCHGEELIHPRRDLGRQGNGVTFEEFKNIIYKTAPAQMGVFSPERFAEPLLRDIFKFMMDEGLRVPVSATIEAGTAAGTYTLTVWNEAIAGKGLTANDVTISVPVPPGTTVANATGAGYQGVSRDATTKMDTMVWKAPRYAPAEKQVYTFKLSGTVPAQGLFRGASVGWASPGTTRIPGLTMRDNRVPEKGDVIVAPGLEFILTLTPARPPAQ